MININVVAQALAEKLRTSKEIAAILSNRAEEIAVNDFVNTNFDNTPWCGVYTRKTNYNPRTLSPPRYKAIIKLTVLAQSSSLTSGEECSQELENFVQKIIEAVIADTKLSNTVSMINNFDVEYEFLPDEEREQVFFQMAVINFEIEASTT